MIDITPSRYHVKILQVFIKSPLVVLQCFSLTFEKRLRILRMFCFHKIRSNFSLEIIHNKAGNLARYSETITLCKWHEFATVAFAKRRRFALGRAKRAWQWGSDRSVWSFCQRQLWEMSFWPKKKSINVNQHSVQRTRPSATVTEILDRILFRPRPFGSASRKWAALVPTARVCNGVLSTFSILLA